MIITAGRADRGLEAPGACSRQENSAATARLGHLSRAAADTQDDGAMAHRIVILGGGTGGTLVANRLSRLLGLDARITVVDRDDRHIYQPGLLFVPFGLAGAEEIVRSRHEQLRDGIDFRLAEVERVEAGENSVYLADGSFIEYDVLVIATGAVLQPEETEGLRWGESVHTFYSLDGARALRGALAAFKGGRLVVNIVDMPIKCPVAPLEFCFLADWQLREHGLREDVELTLVTPLDGAFTKPLASERLGALLAKKQITVQSEFATGLVDADAGRIVSWDEREVPFDLLVAIPVHGGPGYVPRSPGLGDELGFIPTDRRTLQCAVAPNVFSIGDAANVPTSKAGSVTHFEGEAVSENIQRFLEGDELTGEYDGHANCFIETGFHKALLIDFDYDTEPLPGRFPDAHVGLPLMAESRLNHIAKLAFQPLYWHVLLPGRDIPGVGSEFHPAAQRADTNATGGTS
jgi:sulfide:quinone oxidoreductase